MERNEAASYVTDALIMAKTFLDRCGSDREVEELFLTLVRELGFERYKPVLDGVNTGSKVERQELIKLLNEEAISPLHRERLTEMSIDLIQLIEKKSSELNSQITKKMALVYEQQRDESRQWLRFTIIAAALGFSIIVAGIILILLLAPGRSYVETITVGVVTSLSGVVINVISTLFLRQSNNATKQANSTLEKLNMFERFQISAKILSSFETDAKTVSKSA